MIHGTHFEVGQYCINVPLYLLYHDFYSRVRFWRKHRGFTPVSVHVEDENVNLFADEDADGMYT